RPTCAQQCITITMMSAANRSNHQATESHDTVPSGYQKIETDQGTKIVRDSPVSLVRRELNMSLKRQRLWDQHAGTTVLAVSRSFADTSVAPASQLAVPQVGGEDGPLIGGIGVGHGESTFAGAVAHAGSNCLA